MRSLGGCPYFVLDARGLQCTARTSGCFTCCTLPAHRRGTGVQVEEEWAQAELEELVASQRAAQEAELEALERQMAQQVAPGMNVAVYAADDEQRNGYFLLQVCGYILQ